MEFIHSVRSLPLFSFIHHAAGRSLVCGIMMLMASQAVAASVESNILASSNISSLSSESAKIPVQDMYSENAAQEIKSSKDSLLKSKVFSNNSSVSVLKPSNNSATAASEPSGKSTSDARTPDWGGVWRDVGVIFGWQVVAVGVTYALPESFSNWSNEQKKAGVDKYKKNFVNPVWDKDDFYINYVLHPYWGATYYIRARERGLDQTSSFVYSTMMSAMYEFGVECIAEKPSIQDLIFTPALGSLLGAYVFEPWREAIKRKDVLRWYDHTALVLTDPLGVVSLGVEKVFGIKSTVVVDLSVPQISNHSVYAAKGNRIGLAMQFPLY